MSAEEVVDGYIPFSGELKPIRTVPPIAVEMSIGETREFSEGAKDILEDHEKDKQESYHEREEEHADAFSEDEHGFGEGLHVLQTSSRFDHDGEDKFFGSDG
jgi:hypothetical protein